MNSKIISYLLLFAAGAITGILFFRSTSIRTETSQRLSLEQILTIKELHLVKHTYQDLFFLHKKNIPTAPVRAIVRVPVTVTAFIDLKEIKLVHQGDSIRQVILPRAALHTPVYRMSEMVVTKTRAFQWHAGEDLYPAVTTYLSSILTERMKAVQAMAIAESILTQAETEAKEYMEGLLRAAGYSNVEVRFEVGG